MQCLAYCIPVLEEGDKQRSIVDCLIDTPNRILLLLRATSLAATTDALVRVKSHYPEVDMPRSRAVRTPQKTFKPWSSKLMRTPPRWRRASTLKAMMEPTAKVEPAVKVATVSTSSG
jgi:hypothetical protein